MGEIGLVSRPDSHVYDNPRLAAGYAFDRPPVHPPIVDAMAKRLKPRLPFARALDIGCGAGVSTAALGPLVKNLVGAEPVFAMLAHHVRVAPRASFVGGTAERLPFRDAAFDLISAAGSINYTDVDFFLAEAARVLAPDGVIVIYDFSDGRRLLDSGLLDRWYSAFEHLYPPQPGYSMDVRTLDYDRYRLELRAYDEMEVPVSMTLDTYARYVMSGTNVALAIAGGTPEQWISDWCRRSLEPIFGGESKTVLFNAYAAYVEWQP